MYTNYSTTALALRVKLSFYHPQPSLSNEYYGYGSQSCPRNCISCYQSSIFSVPRNPRFIYYGSLLRRQSTLFRLEPSRTLLVPRRTVRVCDGGFDEVIGLLAESQRCCRCCKGEGFASDDGDFEKSKRKEGSWRGEYRGSWKKAGSCGLDAKRTSRNGWRSNYDSEECSSFSGDFEEQGVERRRVVGESSRGGKRKGYGIGRVDAEEKVVREVRKYEDDEDFGRDSRNETKRKGFGQRIRDHEENVSSWRDSGREAREEEYVREEGLQGKNSNGRALSSRRKVSDQRIRVEDENIDNWMDSGLRTKEECVREEQEVFRKLAGSSERGRYSEYKNKSDVRNADRGERSTSFVKLESGIDKCVVGQADSSKSSLRASNVERVSNSQRRSEEERMKDREERFTSANNFVQVTRGERRQVDQRAVGKVEVSEQYEKHVSDSRFRASDTERANSSKSYREISRDDERASSSMRCFEEERMKCRGDKTTAVENLVRMKRDERTQVNQQAINNMEFNKQYENQTTSRIHASSTEKAGNSKSSLQMRADDREEHSTSVVNLVHGIRDNSRVESEWDSSVSESWRGIERVSNLQEVSTIRSESENETLSSVMVQDKKDNRQRSNLIGESLQSTKTQMGISGSSRGGSSSVYQVKNDAIESASRHDESSAMYVGEFVDKLRQETLTLDSSEVHKEKPHIEAYQETTAVELRVDDDITRHKEKYKEESGRQPSSRSGMKGPSDEMWEVRGMSSQEPSKIEEEEEAEESPTVEVDSNTSPGIAENAISRRSHRSLWTYIADIMKIGWAHRARSHSPAKKSGTRSSSNESISSEAWFSGHEPDENDAETEKKERDVSSKDSMPLKKPVEQSQVNMPTSMGTTKSGPSCKSVSPAEEMEWSEGGKGRRGNLSSQVTIDLSLVPTGTTASPSLTGTGNNQMHRSNSPKSEEEFGRQKQPEVTGTGGSYEELKKRNRSPKESTPTRRPVEQSKVGPSTSMETMRRASSSKGVTLVSGAKDFRSSEGKKAESGILSTVDQSPLLTAAMSPPSIPEIQSVQMPGSGLPKLKEVTDEEKLLEIGGTEGREGELKRRKLHRNKQVLREQFEEWEEAYKRESEQRKIDEFFMREALLEAKKAADTWEVPVGAVLVQNGKIIARGCNLVEELRDSTAHAEMICIREASNLLRTWRLSETTLYVTLEPCAMCAGAILQARIDAVVWGAPNKLLGADGSWVRLFPTGDGGNNSLDPTNQMAGPVHPFHPKITVRRGILTTECSDVMQQFFQLRRRKNKKQEQPPSPPSCLPISTQPTKLLTRMHNIFSVMFCL